MKQNCKLKKKEKQGLKHNQLLQQLHETDTENCNEKNTLQKNQWISPTSKKYLYSSFLSEFSIHTPFEIQVLAD